MKIDLKNVILVVYFILFFVFHLVLLLILDLARLRREQNRRVRSSCPGNGRPSFRRTRQNTQPCSTSLYVISSKINFRLKYYKTCSNYLILHRLTIVVVIVKIIEIVSHRSTKMLKLKRT